MPSLQHAADSERVHSIDLALLSRRLGGKIYQCGSKCRKGHGDYS